MAGQKAERAIGGVSAQLVLRLRAICMRLPQAYEEPAWVGVRWMVRKRTFAHVLAIRAGWPPAYARAAGHAGPLEVVTFRTSDLVHDALGAAPGFFQCVWGTRWQTKVVGLKLDRRTNWTQLEELLVDSYALLAPAKLRMNVRARSREGR